MYSLPSLPARRAVRPSPVFLAFVALTAFGGFLAWQEPSLLAARFGVFLLVLSGWVVSLCLHEFGHAYCAHRAGDSSIEARGYLTLNPFKYAHPVLSIALPLFFILQGGFGLPGGAVYLHPHTFKSKRERVIAAGIGPASNVIIGVLLLISTVGKTYQGPHLYFWSAVAFLGFLQLTAAVLNLMPLPGLDGYAMLEPFLQPKTRQSLEPFKPWGMLVVFALLSVPRLNAWFFQFVDDIYRATGADPVLYQYGSLLLRFWQSL
ncbi:Zn-dependent protease [Jatrophihabitans sp. GAS493]|uniref:site-2 protease family protein n=1 Tax=Jatrophihabitans sp. GAS493 TaxID=1907575 RepID=UPI000BB80EDF|nr:site-2 protease family protein [Jatrophihabitans sp. GAS493]SOD74269.1 Zn-dependent protease [Jatrophihabitans sp. GAS493]